MKKDKDQEMIRVDDSSSMEREVPNFESLNEIFRKEIKNFQPSEVERSTQHKIVFI